MNNFNWDNLRFFLAMMRAGNPNAAARLLRVDHNTVRRRVSALESELEARLFDRRDDRYILTKEGETMLKIAESMEGEAESAHGRIGGRNTEIGGMVRVGAPDGLGTLFIAPRLVKIRQMHPQLNIELMVTSNRFDLSRREVDMAIIVGSTDQKRIRTKTLVEVTMRLYASSAYLDRNPEIKTIEDLADHDFVSGIDDFDFGPTLNTMLQKKVPSFTSIISCSSIVAQLGATAAGGGLCCFSKFIAATKPDLIPVLPDQVLFKREIALAIHSDLTKLARIKAVAAFLTDEFRAELKLFN